MRVVILLEDHMKPVPPNIHYTSLGPETIIVNQHVIYTGEEILLDAYPEYIKDWLKKFDGVWTLETAMGHKWKIVHIKEEQKPQTKQGNSMAIVITILILAYGAITSYLKYEKLEWIFYTFIGLIGLRILYMTIKLMMPQKEKSNDCRQS